MDSRSVYVYIFFNAGRYKLGFREYWRVLWHNKGMWVDSWMVEAVRLTQQYVICGRRVESELSVSMWCCLETYTHKAERAADSTLLHLQLQTTQDLPSLFNTILLLPLSYFPYLQLSISKSFCFCLALTLSFFFFVFLSLKNFYVKIFTVLSPPYAFATTLSFYFLTFTILLHYFWLFSLHHIPV